MKKCYFLLLTTDRLAREKGGEGDCYLADGRKSEERERGEGSHSLVFTLTLEVVKVVLFETEPQSMN